MDIRSELDNAPLFTHLELLARQVVEGFMSGIHKSPFHGFSSEFAEHKIYNKGESTRYIDWKLYARTDKLYTKTFEEETNLRCHFILDNSASMYYPEVRELSLTSLNKIGFSVLAIAALMHTLKKQRDAVGLSVYSDDYHFSSREMSNERHYQRLLAELNQVGNHKGPLGDRSRTYEYLHQIAEKIHRRSLIFLFSDLLQTEVSDSELFEALRHLKYNKHDVVVFHVLDAETEVNFDFDNSPRRYIDMETGRRLDLYADAVRKNYRERMNHYLHELQLQCAKYKIKYAPVDIQRPFDQVLNQFFIERRSFG